MRVHHQVRGSIDIRIRKDYLSLMMGV
jgi:hypothetical protein